MWKKTTMGECNGRYGLEIRLHVVALHVIIL